MMPVVTGKTRIWTFAAFVWTALYVVLYVVIAHRDGNGIAWWYVALVAAAAALILAAGVDGATQRARSALLAALVVLVFSGLLGLLSLIGLLLVPPVLATGLAVGTINR
jgi:hypothetical protein